MSAWDEVQSEPGYASWFADEMRAISATLTPRSSSSTRGYVTPGQVEAWEEFVTGDGHSGRG